MENNICKRGVNYLTELQITEKIIQGNLEKKEVFNINSEDITNFNVVHNDLIFEIDTDRPTTEHNLSEIRFYVP